MSNGIPRRGTAVLASFLALVSAQLFTMGTWAEGCPVAGTSAPSITETADEDSEAAWLGVWLADVTRSLRSLYGLEAHRGALIVDVAPGSPADRAGLKKNDVVLAVDKRPIEDADELREFIRRAKPHQQVSLEVQRGREKLTLKVTLERRPKGLSEFYLPGASETRELVLSLSPLRSLLGAQVQDMNRDLAKYFRLSEPKGVLITDVDRGGPADRAGLRPGDVIVRVDGTEVSNTRELRNELQRLRRKDEEAKLTIVREGVETKVTLALDSKRPASWFDFEWSDRESPLTLWFESEGSRLEKLREELEREAQDLRKEMDLLRRELRDLQKQLESLQAEMKRLQRPE
ncbi:MAG: PDZ domain-containing protein [candidate division KSB1 bacterium]|nr:PDZ domain-containing protein [candidate division KSB1 bacterium]